jgi:glycosyltransferase involved in cell wall biosynthesis
MARPRVLGVIASSVPGGAESVFSTLFAGFGNQFEPFVVCDTTGVMVDRYRGFATDLVATPMNAPTHLGASQVIANAIDRWSIDLVHTHLWNADLFGTSAAAWRGCPVVSTVHGSNFLPFGSEGLHRARRHALSLTYRAVYRFCDRVIAPSRALVDDLSGRPGIRVPAARIVVVPNGLDIESTRARASSAVLPASVSARMPAPMIACVANMFAIKGQEWLVRALPEVLASVPQAILVLVGDGESRASIERLVKDLGVTDRVVFTGSLENPLAIVERADVIVLPSLSEGLPIALLEAMALGRAVVASRVGGIPEVIQDGVSGLLVPPSDPAALSKALSRLLLDADLRIGIGVAARSVVERDWSSVQMIARTTAVYEDVLAARGARRSAR